jgi:hypothetical protein
MIGTGLLRVVRTRRVRPIGERFDRIIHFVEEFEQLPRSGDTTYGFALGVYAIPDYPTLPTPCQDQ